MTAHSGFCIVLAGLFAVCTAHAEIAVTDRGGAIEALLVGDEYLPITTNLRIPVKGWGRMPNLGDARNVKYVREDGRIRWEGVIEVEQGKAHAFRQELREEDGKVTLTMSLTAQAEVEIEGVYFWLTVPRSILSGGPGALTADGRTVASATIPVDKPEKRHFLVGKADAAVLASADESTELHVGFSRAINTTVQDTRDWNGSTYDLFAQLAPALRAGETTELTVTLAATAHPDTSLVNLTVDAAQERYTLDGFGGNYCFNIESPVTQYTLKNLNVAWARTEMTVEEWEPQNDNASPEEPNWEYFETRDREGSNLRREFLLAKQIQDMGIPYVISIWDLPTWMYEDPTKPPRSSRQRIAADKWDEMLESVGCYLLYAKRKYGVEPDLFCFNEANIGVRVYFSAEEHRDAIKSIGARFEELGLKTKMLLADATGPAGTHTYAIPASEDPEAMKYVTAVGFHSWGGATPDEYRAWGDLAERLKLPLLVTELGVDAGAWRTRAFDSYQYALREAEMYQHLLLYARPQGTMQWEFTADYSIVREGKDEMGNTVLTPWARYWVVEHFCNLTPRKSVALGTASDSEKVLFTAFRGPGDEPAYTLHIVSLGAARQALINGIPEGVASLRVIVTDEQRGFEELAPETVTDGKAQVELPARGLLSLTTQSENRTE